MIGKDELAEAARYADARSEELGSLERYCEANDIDIEGLKYLAEQRAMRIGMMRDNRDPTKMPRDRFSILHLSDATMGEMPFLMSAWVDGLVTGLAAKVRT